MSNSAETLIETIFAVPTPDEAQAVEDQAVKRQNVNVEGESDAVVPKRGQYPKSISRIETEKHCAWFVRVYYQGAYVRKTFNDDKYNGTKDAFREALKWRDEMERAMGKPRTERSVRKKTIVDERDVGIYRRNAKHLKRGKTYFRDIYEVVWSPAPGKLARTTISVTKHGEEKALEMARTLRREKEAEHFGGVVSDERRRSL